MQAMAGSPMAMAAGMNMPLHMNSYPGSPVYGSPMSNLVAQAARMPLSPMGHSNMHHASSPFGMGTPTAMSAASPSA
jgi:hypothetical protein